MLRKSTSELKDKIKSSRKEKGLSQNDLAEIMGVDRITISKWETGRGVPSYKNLAKLGKELGCDLAYYMDFIETKNYDNKEICKITGLQEKAVDRLKWLNGYNKQKIDIISFLLTNEHFDKLLNSLLLLKVRADLLASDELEQLTERWEFLKEDFDEEDASEDLKADLYILGDAIANLSWLRDEEESKASVNAEFQEIKNSAENMARDYYNRRGKR